MQRIADVGIRNRKTVVCSKLLKPWGRMTCKRRLARTDFANIFLIAQLVVTALALTGCANQNIVVNRPLVTSDMALPSHANSAPAAKATAGRKSARRFDTLPRSESPEQAGDSSASLTPANARPTGLVQPEPSTEANPPAAPADPRNARAMTCRDLMIKEHPPVLFSGSGSATAQRDYFDRCMRQTGNAQ